MADRSSDILVSNIQRFSLHDGPGIRTTVFLQGCSLRCPWCCNPECVSSKWNNLPDKFRPRYYSPNNLALELIKDLAFYNTSFSSENKNDNYNNEGGVTFSGGECLLQIDNLIPLIEILKNKQVNIGIETSLAVELDNIKKAFNLIDFAYVDLKTANEEFYKNVLRGNFKQYLSNFDYVMSNYKNIIIRIPIIGRYNDKEKSINEIIDFFKNNVNVSTILKVEILVGHDLANDKRKSIGDIPGMDEYLFHDPNVSQINLLADQLRQISNNLFSVEVLNV